MPEFLLNLNKIPGVIVGRLYVPHFWITKPEFLDLCKSVYMVDERLYGRGAKLIWFIAPISEYRRLAVQFPHHRYGAYTQYLLTYF